MLPENHFIRDNYTFEGWSDEKDGEVKYAIDSDDAFCIADLADYVDKITAGVAGSYAVSAVVTLTNGTVQLSNYATFVEPNEQI